MTASIWAPGTNIDVSSRYYVSAADYGATGASTVTDTAALNAAILAVHNAGGGFVRINPFINTSIDYTTLTLYNDVVLIDERYHSSGTTRYLTWDEDAEFALYGKIDASNEGPSFVIQNTNTTGNRTVSFASRFGLPAASDVGCILHFGVWDGVTWTPDYDFIGDGQFSGAGDFRSRFRIGAAGTTIINPTGAGKYIDAATAFAAGYSLIVNRPVPPGGGAHQYQFGVKDGGVEIPQELQVIGASAAVRLQNAAGANKWSLVSEYPGAGQSTIYDHGASVNRMVFNTGSATQITGGFTFVAQTAASAPNDTLFKDSADGKLKFKDAGGVVNALY